jgi:chromosome segregation ATPase
MKKITNMTEKEILKELESNEAKRTELREQIAPLEKKLTRLWNRNKKLQEQADKLKIARRTDWEWLLSESGSDSQTKYTARKEALEKIGLGSSGFFHAIQQVQVRVCLIKGDPKSLKQNLTGLKKILKYLKPVDDMIHIDIFERTLSEYGVFSLRITPDLTKFQIVQTTYGRDEVLHTYKTLEKAMEKIQDKYYYDGVDEKEVEYPF